MIGNNLTTARQFLLDDDVIGMPTETVYGLAGNALSQKAVSKIFAVKQRPTFDPLIVHVGKPEHIEEWTSNMPPAAHILAKHFMPGSLTLLLPKKNLIPELVTSGLDQVAIRIPNHPIALALLNSLPFPLAAPSANPFGYVSPTTAEHVYKQLGTQIPYILDGGACTVGIESTIIGFDTDPPTIYRTGGIGIEAIQQLIGTVQVRMHSSSNPKTPGMLKSHYAPQKKLLLGNISELLSAHTNNNIAVLSFQDKYTDLVAHTIILSERGNLDEAAHRLFAALRTLDTLPVELIIAEPVPNHGIGRAINDRLRRAAADKGED